MLSLHAHVITFLPVFPWRVTYICAHVYGQVGETFASECEVKPHIWWRYIDVIFIVWTEGEERLREFTDYLNNVHETIKFTCKWSEHEIEFLDVEVLNESGVLEMEVLISQQQVINICITVLVTWMHVNYIEFVRSPVFLKREWESW